jgi:azurin
VVLKDTGTMPKTAMAHNFVLLKKGADPKAFADKSLAARDTDFIGPAVKHQVLASTKLVGIRDRGSGIRSPEPGARSLRISRRYELASRMLRARYGRR